MSGSASRWRWRFGRAPQTTGFVVGHPLSIASENALERNTRTFRTVFGARPLASTPRASRSTSRVVTESTRRLPQRRRDVDPLHRLKVRPKRRPDPLQIEPTAQASSTSSTVLARSAGAGACRAALGLDHLPQRTLSLASRAPVPLASGTHLADPAIDAAAVRRDPTPVVGAPLRVQRTRAVRALDAVPRHAREELAPSLQKTVPGCPRR